MSTSPLKEGILSTIGSTPLVELTRVFKDSSFRFFAKLEAFNPGGSIKDRAALYMLGKALESGELRPGATVIESSSGNMGIGLAQVCAYLGMKFVCVVDPRTTTQHIEVLKSFGAEIDLVTTPDPDTGEFLQARLNRVKMLLDQRPDSFWPNQYSNLHNARAHYQTMSEIVQALDGKLDFLFCSTSTCGTMRGCAEYAREHNLPIKIIAVDAVGSAIFGGEKKSRRIPGHGAGVRPGLFQPDLAHNVVHVTDLDCIRGCRRLLRHEAILAGGSSGGVLMAVERMKSEIPLGAYCAGIFPDRGERYLDTIYSDAWVGEHFGPAQQLCQTHEN